MKASLFLAASSAMLAAAGPIRANLNKRALETDWVLEIVTVTVTEGIPPTDGIFFEQPAPVTTTTQAPAPPPAAPTTTIVTSIVPAPKEPEPKPEPEPQPEPQPEPAPQPEPQPEPEPEPEAPKTTVKEEAPVPSEPAEAPGAGSDYKTVVLYQHNVHRANHSAPDLEWDDELAQYAENTANGCVFEHDMNQGSGGYGQNLASWGASGDISSAQMDSAAGGITNQWYNDEMMNWSFYGSDDPPSGSDLHAWGHFTQVVWKESTKLGCATVQCPGGSVLSLPAWYTVCNYNPPGNFGGQYGENVLEPLGQARVTA